MNKIEEALYEIRNDQLDKYDDVTVESQGVINKVTFYANGVEKKSIDVLAYAQPQPGTLTINYESYSIVKENSTIVIPYTFNTPNKGDATLYISVVTGTSTKELEYTLTKVGAGSINLGTLTKGIHQLTFYVIDYAGQMTDATTITIVCGALELTSTFDDSLDYASYSSITIPFDVSALDSSAIMTLRTDIDGIIYEKQVYDGYNTFTFPNELKTIGVHHVSMQVVTDEFVSGILEYNIVIADNSTILLSSNTDSYIYEEGYIVEIPYRISIVGQTMFYAKYYINNVLYEEAEVNVGKNTFKGDYSDFPVGDYTLTIEVSTIDGTLTSSINLLIKIITSSFKRITHVTAGLQAYFNMGSKSNTNVDKDVIYSEVTTDKNVTPRIVLHDYNFSTNGWIDGRLVSNGKAWAEMVNYFPLEDNVEGGFTFDILFSSYNVGNNDARVIDYTGTNTPFPGFFIDSEKAVLTTEANKLSSYYTDQEDMRITFVVNRTSTYYEEYILDENGNSVLNPTPSYKPNPMIQTFVNGIFTDVAMLSDSGTGVNKIYESIQNNETLLINTDKTKSLFGNSKIKSIRIYNRPLEHEEVLQNYIADYDNLMDQKAIYEKNYVTVDSDIPTLYFYDTEIGKCDLMTKDTKQWINVVYTSPNTDLFGESFDLMGQTSWQGTSSLAYPVKNYKFKLYDWARDENGDIIEESRNDTSTYSKKKVNMYPADGDGHKENTFCLKADYMDSSHCRNTGTARLVNDFLFDGYANPAKQVDPTTRDTINGFPCNLYVNGRWMGIFNFNHDKSCTKTLGMETIPDTVRWEIKANSDTSAGAFYKTWTDVASCYEAILSDFEIVYDEDAFVDQTGEYDVTKYYDELGFDHDGTVMGSYYDYAILSLARFVNFVSEADEETWLANSDMYFNKVQACRYYLNTMTLGLIDNFAKNCIINMYGDDIWWFSFYDLDSSMGLDNTGYNKFSSNIEPSQPGIYNCSTSKMWVKLNDWNQDDLFNQFKIIREGKYTYENICEYLISKQIDVIPQLLYNKDMYTKYISQGRQYLHMLHGNNKDHLKRWLYNRFQYVDSLFLQFNSPYTKQNITIRSCKPEDADTKYDDEGNIISQYTARFEIQTYCPQYVTVCWRKNTYETKRVDWNETVVFEYDMVNSQDNEIILYCATNLKHLGDCSNLNPTSVDIGNAYRLTEFIVEGSDKLIKADISKNVYLNRVSFKDCSVMGTASGGSNVLDVSECTNLREVDIRGTQITSLLTNTNGGNLETILYPTSIQTVVVSNQVNLEVLGLPVGDDIATNLTNVQILNCNNIKTLMYPYDEENLSIEFGQSMKYVQNLTLDNSLNLTGLSFNGFANLRNLNLKNMLNLEGLKFDDMLTSEETPTLERVYLANIPYLKNLTLNVTSDDYAVKFAEGSVLDLSGLTSLESIESNYSIKGLDKIILPQQLNRMVFVKEYGEGTCDIKRVYSFDSLEERENDILECIDFRGMSVNKLRIPNLLKVTEVLNFTYAPVVDDDKPNFKEGRDGTVSAPYLNIYGSYDITNFVGTMAYLFSGLDFEKMTIINNTEVMPQTDLQYMFSGSTITSETIEEVLRHFGVLTDVRYMFYNANVGALDFSVDTSEITSIDSMFESCSCTTISIDSLDFTKVKSMNNAFKNCASLTAVDLSGNKISVLESCDDIFVGCTSLNELNVSNFTIMNTGCGKAILNSLTDSPITEVDMNEWATGKITDAGGLFKDCTYTGSLNINKWSLPSATTIANAFVGCNMTSVSISEWDAPSLTSIAYMFNSNTNLTHLDMQGWSAPKIIYYNHMFQYCTNLDFSDVELNNWDYSAGISFAYMFQGCTLLEEDIIFPVTATNVSYAFESSGVISIHSNWKTEYTSSKITTKDCYANCENIEEIDGEIGDILNVPQAWGGLGFEKGNVTIFTIDTTLVSKLVFKMPSNCSAVIWGDGSFSSTAGASHTYASHGTYTIQAAWKFDAKNFSSSNNDNTYSRCITEISLLADTDDVTDMSSMFWCCSNLTELDVSGLDTSKVTNMRYMFYSCEKLEYLSGYENFDTSNVTDMYHMFDGCEKLTELDLGKWNTSKVTNMGYMFQSCAALTTLNVSNFNTSKVTNMYAMFWNCQNLTSLNVSNFDTSKVTEMYGMFYGCYKLTSLDVSKFNTSKVTNMGYMFRGCQSLTSLNLSNFDTSNVTSMYQMFRNCYALTSLDLNNFNTSNVTDMGYMFAGCQSLTSLDLNNFDTSNVTNMQYMFAGSYSSDDPRSMSFTSLDLSGWNLKKVTNMKYMFFYCNKLKNVILPLIEGVTYSLEGLFSRCPLLEDFDFKCKPLVSSLRNTFSYTNITDDELTTWLDKLDLSKIENVSTFAETGVTISFIINLVNNHKDTITSLSYLFAYTTFGTIDLSGLDTSNITDMSYMFCNCQNLTSLDLSSLDTSNVTNMSYMFEDCYKLTSLDLSSLDTSNVTDMQYMFNGCMALTTLGLSDFNTSKVTNMYSMFWYCYKLTSLDVSNFDTSNVTNMGIMFAHCRALTSLDLSNFNTSKVTSMSSMFWGCDALTTLDLSSFDVGKITYFSSFFEDCSKLTTLSAPKNIKASLNINDSPLTHDSAMSVINNLSTVSSQTLDLSSTTLALLTTAEIAVATNKGWTVV